MSLFVCDECGVIENTAVAGPRGYHMRRMEVTGKEKAERPDIEWGELGDGKARCSQCNPEIGRWHGMFPREDFDAEKDADRVVNRG